MSISKDDSIVTQVAAKIAGDITVASAEQGSSLSDSLTAFTVAFAYIKEALFVAHGNDAIMAVQTAMPGTTVVAEQPRSQTVSAPPAGSLRIAGTQHGDLPQWLLTAVARDGVTEVWDNRDKAVGTKRPWFKQAGVDSADAKGYWPPKGS